MTNIAVLKVVSLHSIGIGELLGSAWSPEVPTLSEVDPGLAQGDRVFPCFDSLGND
jgi:hypothetical protein